MYICLNKYCCLCCAMFYSCWHGVVYCFTILTVLPLSWHVQCSRMSYDVVYGFTILNVVPLCWHVQCSRMSYDVVYCFTILTVVPLSWHVQCSHMSYDVVYCFTVLTVVPLCWHVQCSRMSYDVYCFTILTVVPLCWHVQCSCMSYDGWKKMLLLQLLIEVIVAPCNSSQALIIISQLRDVCLSFLLFSNILTVVFYPDFGFSILFPQLQANTRV